MSTGQSADFYHIHSNQTGVHRRLQEVVLRHANTDFTPPCRPAQQAVLEQVFSQCQQPVILDLGCGTGMSSERLAQQHPDYLVMGVDKSAARLQRHPMYSDYLHPSSGFARQGNLILLQADVIDLVGYCYRHSLPIEAIKLFYPNPWPKARHLMRRWHGHPIFKSLLNIGVPIELRTNWQIYAKEFVLACQWNGITAEWGEYQTEEPVSLFEKKYQTAGVTLYRAMTHG